MLPDLIVINYIRSYFGFINYLWFWSMRRMDGKAIVKDDHHRRLLLKLLLTVEGRAGKWCSRRCGSLSWRVKLAATEDLVS